MENTLRIKIDLLKEKLNQCKTKKEFKEKRKLFKVWISKLVSKKEYKVISTEIKELSKQFFDRRHYRNSTTESGVYIIHFNCHPKDVFKIGYSHNLSERLRQLDNSSTYGGIEVVKFYKTDLPSYQEYKIHSLLSKYRIEDDREFFKGNLNEMIKIINNSINQ